MREIDKEYAFEDGYNAATNEAKGGDTISREALKKAFENLASDDYNAPIWYQKTVFETIDNAPTVENITIFCENADEKTIEELKAEMQKAKLAVFEERPQGEWKYHGLSKYCSNCGKDCEQNHSNFCGYCGAKMKKGGKE